MSRGPLPDPDSIRRNKPTIPPTKLPAAGYDGEVPSPAYELGESGLAWWRWAWTLPQAAAWDDGAVYALSRRAQLEDDLRGMERADHLESVIEDMIGEAVAEDDPMNLKDRLAALGLTLRKLKSLAGGKLGLLKEMRELDQRFGLDPKAIGQLRWKIVDDQESSEPHRQPEPKTPAKGRHLRAVDRSAVA